MRRRLCKRAIPCFFLILALVLPALHVEAAPGTIYPYVIFTSSGKTYKVWGEYDGEVEDASLEGVSYNLDSNTLTLNNVKLADYSLRTNEMGEDFKIKLVGDNHLGGIFGYGIGNGSIEFTGEGALTLNENKALDEAINWQAEGNASKFIVDDGVTLTAYKGSESYSAIKIYNSTLTESPLTVRGTLVEPLQMDSEEVSDGEVKEIAIVPVGGEGYTRWMTPIQKNDDPDGKYAYGGSLSDLDHDGTYETRWFDLFKFYDYAWGNDGKLAVQVSQTKVDGINDIPEGFTEIEGAKGQEYTALDDYCLRAYAVKKKDESEGQNEKTYVWAPTKSGIRKEADGNYVYNTAYRVCELGETIKYYDSDKDQEAEAYMLGSVVDGSPIYDGQDSSEADQVIMSDTSGYEFVYSEEKTGMYDYYYTNDVIQIKPSKGTTPPSGGNTGTAPGTNGGTATTTKYTVAFNSNGGSAVAAQTVEAGQKASKPADPTRAGYTFGGWYAGNSKWDFAVNTVNSNLTLVAQWTAVPAPAPEEGDQVTSGASKFEVTATGSKKTVEYTGPKSKNAASVTVPASVKVGGVTYKVTSIKENAFKNNKKLKKVTIGSNVTSIGANAFAGCTKLSSVTVGKNATSIGAKAFYQCGKLSKVTLPAKVKSIGKQAFDGCKNLKSVTIKSTKLAGIGKQAFAGCKNLKSITIKSTKLTSKNVGSKAFSGINSKAKIKVPKKKLSAYKKLFQSKGLAKKVKVVKI